MKKELLLILSLVYIVILFLFLFYDHKGLMKGEYNLILFISFIFNIYYAYFIKEKNKKERFKSLFIDLLLLNTGFLIASKFIDVFIVHIFDNNILSELADIEWEALQSELASMGASTSMKYSDVENMVNNQYSLWSISKSLLFTLPFVGVFSGIMAFLFTRPSNND